jgi:hypothetical protein
MKAKAIVAAVVGLGFIPSCTTNSREPTEFSRRLAVAFEKQPDECIPRSWLLEEVQIDAIRSDQPTTPEVFRMIRDRQPGDKVFFYRSPPETWAALLGRSGFAIVRDGKPVKCVDTVIN